MLFIVIEHFKQDAAPVYQRFRGRGRMMPDGLKYIDSWVEENTGENFGRCFQLMETDEPNLFAEWTAHWDDLVDFEIVPVMTSKEALAKSGIGFSESAVPFTRK